MNPKVKMRAEMEEKFRHKYEEKAKELEAEFQRKFEEVKKDFARHCGAREIGSIWRRKLRMRRSVWSR